MLASRPVKRQHVLTNMFAIIRTGVGIGAAIGCGAGRPAYASLIMATIVAYEAANNVLGIGQRILNTLVSIAETLRPAGN